MYMSTMYMYNVCTCIYMYNVHVPTYLECCLRLVSLVSQQAVEEAYVPVIKLEYDGVEVSLVVLHTTHPHLTTFSLLPSSIDGYSLFTAGSSKCCR